MDRTEIDRIRQKYRVNVGNRNKIKRGINPFNEGNEEYSLETINCTEVQKFISYCGVEDVAFFVRFYAKHPKSDILVNDLDKDVDGFGGCVEECIVKVFPDGSPPHGHPVLTDPSDESFRHIFQKDGRWHLVMREYFPSSGQLGKWKTAREYENAFPRVCGVEDELRDQVVYGSNSKQDCDDDGAREPGLYRRSPRRVLDSDVDFDSEAVFGDEEDLESSVPVDPSFRVGTSVSSIAERVRKRAQVRREREERMKSLRSWRKRRNIF